MESNAITNLITYARMSDVFMILSVLLWISAVVIWFYLDIAGSIAVVYTEFMNERKLKNDENKKEVKNESHRGKIGVWISSFRQSLSPQVTSLRQ